MKEYMNFNSGDKVVHDAHGVGTIQEAKSTAGVGLRLTAGRLLSLKRVSWKNSSR